MKKSPHRDFFLINTISKKINNKSSYFQLSFVSLQPVIYIVTNIYKNPFFDEKDKIHFCDRRRYIVIR